MARLDNLIGFPPMVHCPEQRRVLCSKFGIPWVSHFPTIEYPCLDVTSFKTDMLNTQTAYNSLDSALSAILSGTPAHAAVFEEMVRLERSGPNGHLTVRIDGDLPEGGEDHFFVTATDTMLLARRLGINIFEYFAGRGDSPPCRITYSGNHQGPEDGGVYLAALAQKAQVMSQCRRSWFDPNYRLARDLRGLFH